MLPNPEVLKRYRGWKARQAAARMRQEKVREKMEIERIRRVYYDAVASGKSPSEAAKIAHKGKLELQEPENKAPENATPENESKEPERNDTPENNEQKEINFDELSNAELREALQLKGYDVPKTTARVRLIELYKQHVIGE